ncbi:MAG: DUF2062 domain-containing protein [Pseudomonadota bacterium]
MLFRRREKEDLWQRTRFAVVPRRNYARSWRYVIKRVMRIRATPYAIAMGVAAGTFASFTPFMGFHFILSFALAWALRGSMIAAALGTAVGNPLTFPIIWTVTHQTGSAILGLSGTENAGNFGEVWAENGIGALWEPFLKPMIVGGVPLGSFFAVLLFGITYAGVRTFQRRRSATLKLREHQRLQEAANAMQAEPTP